MFHYLDLHSGNSYEEPKILFLLVSLQYPIMKPSSTGVHVIMRYPEDFFVFNCAYIYASICLAVWSKSLGLYHENMRQNWLILKQLEILLAF